MPLAKNNLHSAFYSCSRALRTLLVLNVQPASTCRTCGRSCDFPMMRLLLFRYCSLFIFLAALAVAATDEGSEQVAFLRPSDEQRVQSG